MRHEWIEVGPCPVCGAPGDYKYTITAPYGEGEEQALVEVSFQCSVCGYKLDNEKVVFPLRALYLLRFMMVRELRPVIEKMYYASQISRKERL